MENESFEDVRPIEHGDIPASYVSLPEGKFYCIILKQNHHHVTHPRRLHPDCQALNVRPAGPSVRFNGVGVHHSRTVVEGICWGGYLDAQEVSNWLVNGL